MGNVTQCIAGKHEARVVRPDGSVVEYNYPIQVAMLMTLYPDYMVIQCSIDPVAPGQTRKIVVMDLEDRLALGQSYIMYPIPSSYKHIFNAPPVQDEGMSSSRYLDWKLTPARCSKRAMVQGERGRKRLWRGKVIPRRFLSLFACRSSFGPGVEKERGWVPLLDFDGNDQSFNSTCDSKVRRGNSDLMVYSAWWKPGLDDIPESPYRFHGLPKSSYELH